MTTDKFFAIEIWPPHGEVLRVLGFNEERAFSLFETFCHIDYQQDGAVSVEEFHKHLGLPVTKFSERIFGILDMDGSGQLDFNEFAVGVWNYSTYDTILVTKLAFDIFDVDRQGTLDIYECDALLRMVYDTNRAPKDVLEEIDANDDGEVRGARREHVGARAVGAVRSLI